MEKLYSFFKAACLLVCFLTLHSVAKAQIGVIPKAIYSQDFNSLGTQWIDGVTLDGWYAAQDFQSNGAIVVPQELRVQSGTTTTAVDKISVMSWVNHSSSSSEDRALGFATGNTGNPDGFYGVRFKNNTGAIINTIVVSFDIKTIHDNKSLSNGLVLSYQVGSTSIQELKSPYTGSWKVVANDIDNIIGPSNNDPIAETVRESFTFNVDVPIGHEFFIRLHDSNIGGNSPNDDDISIDNFIVDFNPGPLPVTLTSFSGSRSGDVVNLAWATASEKDNDFFEVQQSEDGKSFKAVGERVKGAGTTAVAQSYKATVSAQTTSTIYFRLKQVDFDGKFEYSKVIAVKGAGKTSTQASLGVYPNPTSGKLFVTSAQGSGPVTVTLFHGSGRAVSQRQVNVQAGQPISLDLAGQAPGVYYVQVQTDEGKSTTRVVKQ